MRLFFLFLLVELFLGLPLSAWVIFVPLHDDFVVFDLESQKIIYRLNYAENNFGVSLMIDPEEGRYLFYRPRFGLSAQVIRYDFVSGERQVFTHHQEFIFFRPISKNHGVIDGQMWELTEHGTLIPSSIESSAPLMWREVITAGQTTITVSGDSMIHTITPSGTQLKELYWSPSLQGFVMQLTENYQENSWNNRYYWAFYDVQSKKLTRFDVLSGRIAANSGGAMAPEMPRAQLLPSFVLSPNKGS
jgi:hypothetical protein